MTRKGMQFERSSVVCCELGKKFEVAGWLVGSFLLMPAMLDDLRNELETMGWLMLVDAKD